MKQHTIDFKNQLTELGRELRGVITYNNTELEEEIYSITPHYNADLLKSVMKQLDLELSVDIPLNTIINCQIGIKVNEQYEMLNYGNYVVYKSEKQEDTNTYKLTCYDKLLYSMKKNEDLGVEYPIKIKDYLIALGNKIGLSVANTTFYNQDMKIPSELYLGQDYTYRDILDEIAQATGSIICLNENDEIQVKYPTQTNDTIDEEYLKDVNVKFGKRYGAINTIVLSRAGESDNVYYPSPLPQNPVEIKIVDNQIMNFNNRSDFLKGIYNALNGLYYYINDFTSTGILYYDVGDLYNVRIGENTYQCLMLNDEVNVTTGIEEIVHTDMPEKSETDYSKADKTDMRINKTYLIVDKQNQKIKSVVDNVTEQNNKISQITQTVDDINSKIQDIADITTYGESDRAEVELTDVNESEPIMIKVHPTSTNISYLYPSDNLYPSDTQYIPNRIVRFTRTYEEDGTTKTENIDYLLPDDLLRYSDTVYDEFYLNYESQTCQVIKRCAYNADGTVRALGKEITTDYEYPTITLGEGNYTITLPGYDFGYVYVRLMAKNIYTTQFYTKAETDSRINQKANEINLGVNKSLTNYSTTNEMNSAIDLKAKEITASVSEKTKNNLETVTVEYALGSSTTTAPTSGWSTTAPTWQQGKYMWQRTKTKTADGTESISNPTCIAGAKGQDGTNGTNGVSVSSITEYYAVSSSNSSAPADSSFQTAVQTMTTTNKYLWNYELITYSNNTTSKTSKRVIGVYGDKGNPGTNGTDGTNGKDGIGIKSVTNKYQVSTSNTTAPTSWSDTPQTMTPINKYLWNYEIITYSNNTTTNSKPAVIGTYGDKGQAGTNGTSVSKITEYYAVSSSNSSAPADSSFKTTMQTMTATNKYLWNYEIITFSDNSTQPTTKRVIGVYGDKGIGIKSVTNKYQVSTSNTTAPTSWSDTPQTMTPINKYLWNYEIITYSNNTTTNSKPAVIGTYGDKGDKGNTGDTGKGVKAVVAQYYLSSSKTTQTGGSWTETQPAYKKDYYYWTRTKITWTDNTTTYTTPILVEEINSLNKSVASLAIRTGSIESSVAEKVGKSEFGTYITQNKDYVKLAWNQISEYIQMMIINNNASFAILDSSKKPIAYFDKTGMHFSSNNTAFGEMGVQTVDGNKFIAFSVDGKYGQAINNGMAWGIKTTTDNKFHPILYIKNFEMGPLNSDTTYGELVLSACNLVLEGIETGIISGNVKLYGDALNGMIFEDTKTGKILFNIMPEFSGLHYDTINILENISFYANQAGSNSFKIGTGDNYCLFTDDGAISGNNLYIKGSGTFTEYLDCYKNINCDGNVYAKNISSDKRLKKNIKNANDNAIKQINKIKIKSFDWKEDNVHTNYGFIAQELEKIDKNYVLKQKVKDKNIDYKYYVNELPILATATKAIQEQQEEIEELKKEIEKLKGGK